MDVKKMKAKEFPLNHTWFNVSEPLTFEYHLKKKLVVIDFWTYCCINCLHVLPDLEYLEDKYLSHKGIVFMGCHSAKFTNEKGAQKVRDAILKYEVKHPVINDDRMMVWRNFERRSWPSLMVCNPRGVPIFIVSGEGHRHTLDLILSVAYKYYEKNINTNETIPYELEESKTNFILPGIENTPERGNARSQNMKYPGKIVCIEKQKGIKHPLLVVSDTGNNRLLIINADTMVCEEVIGNKNG